MSDDVEREISEAAYGRRTFLRRLAVGSAFAVPVVSSFSMAGVQAVSAHAAQNTISNCNSTVFASNQFGGGDGPETYGNLPLCGNQQGGFIGFLEDIFSIFQHGK